MVTGKEIEEKYAAMPDGELLRIATEESGQLTALGYETLKKELTRRNIPIPQPELYSNQQVATANDPVMEIILDETESGTGRQELIQKLVDTGIEEDSAIELLATVPRIARLRLQKASFEIMTGSLLLICGIAVHFLPISPMSNQLFRVAAWVATILGALRLIKGLYYKGRNKKILEQSMKEQPGR